MNLELRKWKLSNRKEFVDVCNYTNQLYLPFDLPYPMHESDAKWWLEYAVSNDGLTGLYRSIWMEDTCVGQIYIRCMDEEYGLITCFLKEKYVNQGIMTEAVSLLCELSKDSLGIQEFRAYVCQGNIASQRVLEKNGFYLVETRENIIVRKDGAVCDRYTYLKK